MTSLTPSSRPRRPTAGTELENFLPAPTHPLRPAVLRELVRVDLEYRWQRGCPRPLDYYLGRFPALRDDPEAMHSITFEEYRLRRQAGETVTPEDYRGRFQVAVDAWPCLNDRAFCPTHVLPPSEDPQPTLDPGASRLPSTRVVSANDPDRRAASLYRRFLLNQKEKPEEDVDFDVHPDISVVDDEGSTSGTPTPPRFPALGTRFLGFELIEQLGQGAFGRVYLARQGELANRLVALKVSADLFDEEPQTLAQLQHSNIVPVYSIHRARPLQAVCMPYLGSTTLADVLKNLRDQKSLPGSGKGLISTIGACKSLTRPAGSSRPGSSVNFEQPDDVPAESSGTRLAVPARRTESLNLQRLAGMTYVEAVLWIFARLADGLAHAHERGILHRDLKPANVLLTEDGTPMLLDFNLSEDVKLRAGSPALIGGTLLYMAPEHLAAFQGTRKALDGRSDVFSLGVLLYELLTGRRPYPAHRGPLKRVLPGMLKERLQPPPSLRRHNRSISPAVESIVRHCLEPDPAQRYQSARELYDDLERQRHHLPLRYAPEPSWRERLGKFSRRHPRLSSPLSVGAAALFVLLTALALGLVAMDRRATREAEARFDQFAGACKEARLQLESDSRADDLAQGLELGKRALAAYQFLEPGTPFEGREAVSRLTPDKREQLRRRTAELLVLMTRGQLIEAARRKGDLRAAALEQALLLNDRAISLYPDDQVPSACQALRDQIAQARNGKDPVAGDGTPAPQLAGDWYLLACAFDRPGHHEEVLPYLEKATEREAQNFWFWYTKARVYEQFGRNEEARACLDTCIALDPNAYRAYYQRALLEIRRQFYDVAVHDLDRAIELLRDVNPPDKERLLADIYIDRGNAHNGSKEPALALADWEQALKLGRPEPRIFFKRAEVLAKTDPAKARREWLEGMRLQPADELNWTVRGYEVHALATRLKYLPSAFWTCPVGLSGPVLREAMIRELFLRALADFDRALELTPWYHRALVNKASILSEDLNQVTEAVEILNQTVRYYPADAEALGGRATLLARLGKRQEAHADARKALRKPDVHPIRYFQAAGVFALTSQEHPEDREQALKYLGYALTHGFGFEEIATDPDLNALRQDPRFRELADAARVMRQAANARVY